MKSQIEINESISGCKIKIAESYQNEQKFSSVMTPAMRANYAKTRSYITGWIDCLEGNIPIDDNPAYKDGYRNAKDWVSRNG